MKQQDSFIFYIYLYLLVDVQQRTHNMAGVKDITSEEASCWSQVIAAGYFPSPSC